MAAGRGFRGPTLWLLLLAARYVAVVKAQSCTTDDFAINYNGVNYFTVSSANNTCMCNQLQTASGGVSRLYGGLQVSSSATFSGGATVAAGGLTVTNGQTVNIGTSGSTTPFNVFGTATFNAATVLANVVAVDGSTGAFLKFSNTVPAKKISLWDSVNNAGLTSYQYMGFGVSNAQLDYMLADPSQSHVFYSSTSASARTELLRVAGSGTITIGGTLSVNGPLGVGGSATFNGGVTVAAGGLTVTNGQTVNIGTSGSSSPLNVYGNSLFTGSSTFNGAVEFRSPNANSATAWDGVLMGSNTRCCLATTATTGQPTLTLAELTSANSRLPMLQFHVGGSCSGQIALTSGGRVPPGGSTVVPTATQVSSPTYTLQSDQAPANLFVPGNLFLGGTITYGTGRTGLQVAINKVAGAGGGLGAGLTGSFTASRGAFLFFVSATGYTSGATLTGVSISVAGTVIGYCHVYFNEASSHRALACPVFYGGPYTPGAVSVSMNALSGLASDYNDAFTFKALELPF